MAGLTRACSLLGRMARLGAVAGLGVAAGFGTAAGLDVAAGRLARLRGKPAPVDLIPLAVQVGVRADLPRRLPSGRLYLIGEPAKWAVCQCPCGTGHQIDLNLAHPGLPRWSVALDERHRPSLRPSVDVRAQRRCHFWLISGEVRWCADATRTRYP